MTERHSGLFSEDAGEPHISLDISSIRQHRGGVTTARGSIGHQETLFTAKPTPNGRGTEARAITPITNRQGDLIGLSIKLIEVRQW